MVRTKDAQTPAGTAKGGGVYPLAPTLPYIQEVTPVTIVSTVDTNGKQQPYTIAPDTGILDSFKLQGGDSGAVADGATAVSDPIDMSLYDSLILYPYASVPLLPDKIEFDVIGGGSITADDGTQLIMDNSAGSLIQIKHATDSLLFTDLLNDPDTTPDSATTLTQYKITALHGLFISIAIKNDTGGALTMNMYHKKVRFLGA